MFRSKIMSKIFHFSFLPITVKISVHFNTTFGARELDGFTFGDHFLILIFYIFVSFLGDFDHIYGIKITSDFVKEGRTQFWIDLNISIKWKTLLINTIIFKFYFGKLIGFEVPPKIDKSRKKKYSESASNWMAIYGCAKTHYRILPSNTGGRIFDDGQ